MQILVVDNNDKTRETLCEILTEDGHATVSAASGHEALDLMRRQPWAIVLLDLMLVGMSGIELLATIKQEAPETEVVVMTGHPCLETVVSALRLQAHDYLVKSSEGFATITSIVSNLAAQINAREKDRAEVDALKSELTSLRKTNELLSSGIRDPRTGLYNSDYFDDALKSEFNRTNRNQRPFSLVLIKLNPDIHCGDDKFQVRAIDTALPSWSKIIQERLRKSDIIARYDDNILSIILPETGKDGALLVAECLIQLCDGVTTAVLGQEIEIADLIQVGIASCPDDGDTRDKLFDLASKRSNDFSPGKLH